MRKNKLDSIHEQLENTIVELNYISEEDKEFIPEDLDDESIIFKIELPEKRHCLTTYPAIQSFEMSLTAVERDTLARIQRSLSQLKRNNLLRSLKPAVKAEAIASMVEDFPTFKEVIEDIAGYLSLLSMASKTKGEPVYLTLPNILLVGAAGAGKTLFVRELSKLLEIPHHLIAMSCSTAGFTLSGLDPSWTNSKPGMVFQNLAQGEYANPVLILDEIDKVGEQKQHDPLGALYQLLEKSTAKQFKDEFISVPIDASRINWFATANYIELIPEPILSRFKIYHIPDPTEEEGKRLVQSVYKKTLEENVWGEIFEKELDEEVRDSIYSFHPRQMQNILFSGFSNAGRNNRNKILLSDLIIPSKKRKIGF